MKLWLILNCERVLYVLCSCAFGNFSASDEGYIIIRLWLIVMYNLCVCCAVLP